MNEIAVEIRSAAVLLDPFLLQIKDLEIPKGYVTGMIGRNGAGKTTLIKLMLNLLREAKVEVKILGMTMKEDDLKIKDRIGYVSDSYLYPKQYSAKKLAKYVGNFYSRFDDVYFNQLLKRLDINPNQKAESCSEGTKSKLSLAFALACHPDLLILDEPTAHLDPIARKLVLDLLYEVLQQEENTVLFSTHITEDLDSIADYILHIEKGHVLFNLSKEDLVEEYQWMSSKLNELPLDLEKDIRNCVHTEFGFEGLCVQASKYKDREGIQFKRLSIGEIMVALNQTYHE